VYINFFFHIKLCIAFVNSETGFINVTEPVAHPGGGASGLKPPQNTGNSEKINEWLNYNFGMHNACC
jgi:hypothetical protein